MQSIQFWRSWPAAYRRIFVVLALAFAVAIIVALVSYIRYPQPLFSWQQFQELQQIQIPVYSFELGGFNLTIFADNYIVFERWASGPLTTNMNALDLYLGFFAIGLVILLAVISVLPRFWFYVAGGIAVFAISSMQFEGLQLAGLPAKSPTVMVMLMLLGPCVYFQFFGSSIQFLVRVLTLTLAAFVIGVMVVYLSAEAQPLRYMAVHTLPLSFVLLAVLIIMVAHEIPAAFVGLVTQGHNPRSLQQFVIISLFYLLNLWLSYLNKVGWVNWGFLVEPVLLLGISSVLAIWGIRQRQPQYENILPADPFAVYFMLGLCIVGSGTVGYLFGSGSDVAIRSLNYLTLYALIGYGMVFLMYMTANFLGMLSRNLPVHKVLYKPNTMPYFTFRLAGLIVTIAILVFNSWMGPFYNFVSTYYTANGDLYSAQGASPLAMAFYNRAHYYTSYNQHASSALAALEAKRERPANERKFLADANSFKPTEYTLVNAANFHFFAGENLKELLLLQEAAQKLPKSGVIKNNLGLAHARLGVLDSAYYYFSAARKDRLTQSSASMNLLGIIARNKISINLDSVYHDIASEPVKVKVNALAIANNQQKLIESGVEIPKDSILDLFSAAVIGNYITNHLHAADTAFLNTCVALARKKENDFFHEMIIVPAAKAFYASGNVNRAFELLRVVIAKGYNQGAHNTTLALWSLEQGKPDVALTHVGFAIDQKSTQAILANAVAVAEAGKINEAVIAWDTLRTRKDSVVHQLAESMVLVLACPPSWFADLKENEKYLYLRYRVPIGDSLGFESLVKQIPNENLRAKAILDRSKKWFARDETARAIRYFQKLQGLHLTEMRLFDDIKYFELRLFASQGQWPKLQEQIQKGVTFGPYKEGEGVYYSALVHFIKGDTARAAREFNWLATSNPYFDEGVVTAASFFDRQPGNKQKVYTILSEALLVNPNSVKILKAYIAVATRLGYHDFAASALNTLRPLISASAYQKVLAENQPDASSQ
jgi:tetratricopeptide (TPR) repeat protein